MMQCGASGTASEVRSPSPSYRPFRNNDYPPCTKDGWFTQREIVRIMIAQRLPRLVCCAVQPFQRQPLLHRFLYSTDAPYESTVDISTPSLSPRWLSDIKERLGRCIMFGMKPDQVDEGGQIAQELARDWRTLIAGGEGFLTGKGR